MGIFDKLLGNAGIVASTDLAQEYGLLLCEGEQIEVGFKVIRDTFIFTNKRLILIDKQGITGKKVEYLSIGYRSVSRYSIETAGHFDADAELKIWISGNAAPIVQKKFSRQVNVYDLQKVLAQHVL